MIKNDETLKPSLIKSLRSIDSIITDESKIKFSLFTYYSSVHADSDILEMPGRELFHSRRIFDSMGKIAGLGSIFEAQK